MSQSQKSVYHSLFQSNDLAKQWNVISGCPGTGKTFLINAIRLKIQIMKYPHYIVAPTNLTAREIKGSTIHSVIRGGFDLIQIINSLSEDRNLAFYWGSSNPFETIKDIDFLEHFELHLMKFKTCYYRECLGNRNNTCNSDHPFVVLIDEIGLVSIPLFYLFIYLLPKNTRIIMFGDEHQIQPISNINKSLFDIFSRMDVKFIQSFHLMENIRHAQNTSFQKFIIDWYNDDRLGEEIPHLKFGGNENDFFTLRYPKLVICGRNETAEIYKRKMMLDIKGNLITIEPIIDSILSSVLPKKINIFDEKKFKHLSKNLYLKPDTPVIMTRTISNDISLNNVFVFMRYDSKLDLIELRNDKIKFKLKRYTTHVKQNSLFVYSIDQFPIDLYFAVTIHKIQGMTLTMPIFIVSEDFWTEEQAYVAVSRVTTPGHIYSDVDPLLLPKSLTRYLVENIDQIKSGKVCSECKLKDNDMHLIEGKNTRRLTDETHNILLICKSCFKLRNIKAEHN
jgi:hypothetical protein